MPKQSLIHQSKNLLTPTSQVNIKVVFLVLSMYLKVKMLVAQLCSTLCSPMVCSPPGSSVHGILQARIPEWLPSPGDLLTQGSNPGLLHYGQTLYPLNHQESSEQVHKQIFLFGAQFPERCRWIECVSLSSLQHFCLKKKKARVSDSCRIQQVAVFSLRCSRLPYHCLREGSQPDFLCIY